MPSSSSEWYEVEIGQLGKVVTGDTPSTEKPEFYGDKYPFITPSDLDFGSRTVQTERFLSEKGKEKLSSRLLPADAVCFTSIGATIGKMCMTTRQSFTNQQINSIVVDKTQHDPRFVYYLLRHNTEQIKMLAGGAATPIISKSKFAQAKVVVPPLPTQRKIAAILSAYDDLIENNTRRIKILEEMARLIYREWFVHFRFPGHEQVRMVDSELSPIPEGWEVKQLGDVIELAYGKGLRKSDRVPGPYPVYGSSGVIDFHKESLVAGPGIVVGRKGNVGSVFWSDDDFYPIDTVFYVRTNACLHYIYYNLQYQNFISTDTAVPGLNRNQAYLLPFLLPDTEVTREFQDFISPIFQQVRNLRLRNANLRRTRDLLLPRLISGQLDVSDLPIDTGGVDE